MGSNDAAVIVTGATGGLGTALVRRLLDEGARVAVPFRREEDFRSLAGGVDAGRLFGHPADLTDAAQARAFVEAAVASLHGLDGVALLAGAWAGGLRFEEAPADEWARMMRTNLDTTVNVCRAAIPRLAAKGGSVVAVGSRAAQAGGDGMAAYAVSKEAVHALVRILAVENRDRGVRFNAVLPGTIDTSANRAAMPGADRQRWTSPEAIAATIAFLLSPASTPISGALVPVDGPA